MPEGEPFSAASIATGAGGMIGSGIVARRNRRAQRKENAKDRLFNAQQSQIGRDFTERMSNTAYQRSMADMREAGLNPVLAYKQGGAGTPPGGAASASSKALPPRGEFKIPFMELKMMEKKMANIDANTANTLAQERVTSNVGTATGVIADAISTARDFMGMSGKGSQMPVFNKWKDDTWKGIQEQFKKDRKRKPNPPMNKHYRGKGGVDRFVPWHKSDMPKHGRTPSGGYIKK